MNSKKERRVFVAINTERGMKFCCKNQLDFSKYFNLSQSKISDCLSGKLSNHKGWIFYHYDKEIEPVINWKLPKNQSFIYVGDDNQIISYIDEYSAYLINKFKEN